MICCPCSSVFKHKYYILNGGFSVTVEEYEADALMVPSGCKFNHLHDQDSCMTHDEWKQRAVSFCRRKNFKLNEYAILLSCGTDLFTGKLKCFQFQPFLSMADFIALACFSERTVFTINLILRTIVTNFILVSLFCVVDRWRCLLPYYYIHGEQRALLSYSPLQ